MPVKIVETAKKETILVSVDGVDNLKIGGLVKCPSCGEGSFEFKGVHFGDGYWLNLFCCKNNDCGQEGIDLQAGL